MPDPIDRWENEGGAVEHVRVELAPNQVAGSLPGRAPAPTQGTSPDASGAPASRSTSDTVDIPRVRRAPAGPR